MYNDTIARYIEDINLKYGIALSYMHLEISEIGHWAKMLQVVTCSNDQPEPQQQPQPQQQLSKWPPHPFKYRHHYLGINKQK